MKRARNIRSAHFCQHSAVNYCATILLLLLAGLGLSAQAAFAQTGYSGIFGGGPYYKSPSVSIPEIEKSGFTEAIVWSVEVSSVGDLNFNGEFPLTSGGVYVGNETYPNFAADLATLKQGAYSESHSASAPRTMEIGKISPPWSKPRAPVRAASFIRTFKR